MQFNTLSFAIFFTLCFVLYYRVSDPGRKWLLLGFSLFFYACFSLSALGILLLITLISFCGERILAKRRDKRLLFLFIAGTLLPLVLLKYTPLAAWYALPVGISFFSLQAVGAMIDAYRAGATEGSFGDHLLFLSFFPTVVSGPIMRKGDFLKEIYKTKAPIYQDVRTGFYRIALGFIEKFFLADRIGGLVNHVYSDPVGSSGIQIVAATVLFGLQLYYDFAGYSHMAIGFAGCFGISIGENFERPYFALSVKEFWRRWHISLSSWLRDYVYIPLGGSRCGRLRKYGNLMLTFLVSGIWHGYGLNYLFWGFLHGIYQVTEDCLLQGKKKYHTVAKQRVSHCRSALLKVPRMLLVFVLVDFAWLFFRAQDMTVAVEMVTKIWSDLRFSSLFTAWWFEYGMSKLEYLMWGFVTFGILALDILEERNRSFWTTLGAQKAWLRWSIYACVAFILVITLMIGIGNNTNQFLYQNF